MTQSSDAKVDVLLVGAGIMSATLAMLIKELDPNLTLNVVEMLSTGAKESSNPWNNAGTGHAGLCELNYTPIKQNGSIDISKSKNINFQFEESKQFWAYLAKKGVITTPTDFISPVPHISFVQGKDNVAYLKKRFIALKKHYAFEDIEFTEDYDTMCDWMPLMMKGRTKNESIAATRVKKGTDVNFGSLTHGLLNNLETYDNASIHYNSKVIGLQRKDNTWQVTTKNLQDGSKKIIDARFVFLGAGGGALQLLQMSDIKEGKGFGGFPVSGQWLRCDNQEIVKQHYAKVYSQSEVGSPPMSVPHLDTRIVEGKQSLLFGPYAGFSSKFLCHGSYLDLPLSIRPSNIGSMLAVARDNFDLTRYLVKEVLQSEGKRFDALRQFYPQLDTKDWRLELAGQRVQIIKKHPKHGGILQFGTELVTAEDCSLVALLGASPGASVAVSIMLDLIKHCFADKMQSVEWITKLEEIFSARIEQLAQDSNLYRTTQEQSHKNLHLDLT